MFRQSALGVIVAVLAFSAGGAGIHASGNGRTLVVTMTNDPNANQIRVYDAESHGFSSTAVDSIQSDIRPPRRSRAFAGLSKTKAVVVIGARRSHAS